MADDSKLVTPNPDFLEKSGFYFRLVSDIIMERMALPIGRDILIQV